MDTYRGLAEMKIFAALLLVFVIRSCDGQTHPTAWGHHQRSRSAQQENSNDVLVNTDRLMSSLENRISSLVRSETGVLKQQLSRLEQSNARLETAVASLKADVASLKTELNAIRDENNQEVDLSNPGQVKPHPNSLTGKFENLNKNLNYYLGGIRNSVIQTEKDVVVIKKNLRSLHAARQKQHIALVPSQNDELNDSNGACTANDLNTETGLRKIGKFFAFCEMDADEAGGWIVIQKRFDGSTDFFRTWNEYKDGFGNLAGEFWLGLDKIYELTSSRLHELKIVIENFSGETTYAKYSAFGIAGEQSMYALNMLGSHSGDVLDSFTYHAGMKFSTFDNDNDAWADGNCARSHLGGWWYNSCDESNLNGRYFEDGQAEGTKMYQGVYWSTFGGSATSLKSVKMMIRRVPEANR